MYLHQAERDVEFIQGKKTIMPPSFTLLLFFFFFSLEKEPKQICWGEITTSFETSVIEIQSC